MCTLFARGVTASGGEARVIEDEHPRLERGDVFVYGWTPQAVALIREAKRAGRDWYYADNAYYFGRGTHFRITRNRLMHDGLGRAGPERFAKFGCELRPWRTRGDHVVLATQSETFYRDRHQVSRGAWTDRIVAELAQHTRRAVIVCHKPDAAASGNAATHPGLEAALVGAWALVTHSSSAAVKAILDGVPVFCDPICMAASVGRTSLAEIERPVFPGWREQWLWNLAANQWTWREIESGRAWRDLQE